MTTERKLLIFALLVTALGATSVVLLLPWYSTVVETRDVITYSYAVPVPPREQTGYVFILQRPSGAMGDVLNPKTQKELGTVFLEAGWKISVAVEALQRLRLPDYSNSKQHDYEHRCGLLDLGFRSRNFHGT